ncbi:MAG: DUF4864 domain-containing protein [Nitriliruptor sp.]
MRSGRMLVVVALVVATGCTAPDLPPETADGSSAGSTSPPDDPLADTSPAPEPPPPDAPSPRPPGDPCTEDDLDAIDEVIGGQLAAFAADDYAEALTYASEGFRAGRDAAAFETMIEESFPVAADAVEHRSGACVQRDGNAEVRVEVTAADGERGTFVYLLVEEDGWRIAGAVPVALDDPDATTV